MIKIIIQPKTPFGKRLVIPIPGKWEEPIPEEWEETGTRIEFIEETHVYDDRQEDDGYYDEPDVYDPICDEIIEEF